MTNRIGPVTSKLKTDKQLARGEWDEKVRSDENICVLKWKDTKAVTIYDALYVCRECTCRYLQALVQSPEAKD